MKAICCLWATIFIAFTTAFAQPVNDECAGAIALSTTSFGSACTPTIAVSTAQATASTPGTTCGGNNDDDDIWYVFTATSQSAIARISNALNTTGSTATIAFEIYSDTCGALTTLLCNTVIAFGSGHQLVTGLTIGNTYYLRFWTGGVGNAATFNLCVQEVPPPPINDNCSGALPITTQSYGLACAASVSVQTAGATKSTPNADCSSNDINDDVWYRFTANSASVVLRFANGIITTNNNSFLLGYALYNTDCPLATTTVSCASNFGFGSGHQIINGLSIGTTYYLRLFTFGANNYGSFDFCVQDLPPPPVNDDCSGAIPIATQPYGLACATSVNVQTAGATKSTPNADCSSNDINDDVWYRFTANSASVVLRFTNGIITTNNNSFLLGYALYQLACPTTTTTIACSSNFGFGSGQQVINGLSIGTTYYLRLFTFGTNNYGNFDFCVQDVPAPPVNDDCNNAIPITLTLPGTSCFASVSANTAGATPSVPAPSCGVADSNDDIWYSFTASTATVVMRYTDAVLSTSTGSAALGYALYSSACPIATTTISCDASFGLGSGTVTFNGLTAGTVYYLRLYFAGSHNYGSFRFCLQQQLVNDECSQATNLPVSNGFCYTPTISSLNGATTSPGFGMQSCAATTNTKDVWFKATIPATGNLIVQTSPVKPTANDLVMSAHTGNCGTLTQIACDDNGNPETVPAANHSRITLSGRTPGEVIYFRVTPFFTSSEEQFAICAWDESPALLPLIASAGNCTEGSPVTIDSALGNMYMWVPLVNNSGEIIASFYANGNFSGVLNSHVFVNTSAVRQQNDSFYLDRNIAITAAGNATNKIRMYLKHTELEALKTADSTVSGIGNLRLLGTASNCQTQLGNAPVALNTLHGTYGTDYYLQADFTNRSGFYATTLCGPVVSWTGNVNTDWKNPGNWSCGGVPWKYNQVLIPTGAPRYPVVAAPITLKGLQLQANTAIDILPGVSVVLTGQ